MQHRNIGKSGLNVSVLALGCSNLGARIDFETARKVVDTAFDLGITLFDTADAYGNRGGSESVLGELLGSRRKDIVLASKFRHPMDDAGVLSGASRRYIMTAVEASLRRLKTDWIDLYQLHRPDPRTPIEETLGALDDLIKAGKVRYIGCSNLPGWQVVEAQWTAKQLGSHAFISCQDEYNLIKRDVERELLPAMQAHDLGLLPYFPLASGLLTGKYKRNAAPPAGTRLAKSAVFGGHLFLTDDNLARAERLQAFAQSRGRSVIELACSWLLARPPVASIIVGVTSAEQLRQNVGGIGWNLTFEDLLEIDKLTARQ
jgi:aryl-alcohol dehydrogenase-like predicted oxidoreductase